MIDYISKWTVIESLHELQQKSPTYFELPLDKAIGKIRGIPAADVRPKWISVEDALPENDGDYLAWFQDAKCCKVVEFNKHTAKERHVWWFAGIDRTKFVTHWMPLPESPNCGADMREEDDE